MFLDDTVFAPLVVETVGGTSVSFALLLLLILLTLLALNFSKNHINLRFQRRIDKSMV